MGIAVAMLTGAGPIASDGASAGGAGSLSGAQTDLVSEYQMVGDAGRPKVKFIVTTPANTTGKVPGIYLAPWLSCDSHEYKGASLDGYGMLMEGLVRAGYVLGRTEKPGINGSEGNCAETDFDGELAGYRAGFRAFLLHARVDSTRVYVLGLSNGGAYAPLVSGDTAVRGFVVSGGWARTWFEHMIEVERKLMLLRGIAPIENTRRMKLFSELYSEYLLRQRTPGAVVAERPYLKEIWNDDPTHQYGRPVSFHHQLQKLNIAEVWSKVKAPVLSMYGEYDQFMSEDDHKTLAQWANQRVPGSGRFVAIPKASHTLDVLAKPSDALGSGSPPFAASSLDVVVKWLKEH